MKKILETIATFAMIFLVAVIWNGVFHIIIREAGLDSEFQYKQALEEYKQAYSERADLNISHLQELKELSTKTKQGTTSVEDTKIGRRLSQIMDENKEADEKLAKVKQKFCDLAGERNPLCLEKQELAPRGFI